MLMHECLITIHIRGRIARYVGEWRSTSSLYCQELGRVGSIQRLIGGVNSRSL